MNPDTTIRPWLLACGSQFGINAAYGYRRSDSPTRFEEPYCTYRVLEMRERTVASIDLSTAPASGNDLTRKIAVPFSTFVEIKLFNSQDGLYELAAFTAAVKRIPAVRELFAGKAAYREAVELRNDSTWDDERIYYEHTMVCRFEENASIELEDINAVIDDISLTLESGSHTWTIDDTGYE